MSAGGVTPRYPIPVSRVAQVGIETVSPTNGRPKMAEQHLCQRHGRPAVASRVRHRPDGTQETEYLCEIDLAEERMGRLGGGRSLFDEFFSDFFDSPGARGGGAAPAQATPRRAETVDVT